MKIHAYPYNDFVIPFLIGTVLLFAIIMLLTIFQMRMQKKWVNYD